MEKVQIKTRIVTTVNFNSSNAKTEHEWIHPQVKSNAHFSKDINDMRPQIALL
jgi:hypothetical protein